jgi:hypothetical protein
MEIGIKDGFDCLLDVFKLIFDEYLDFWSQINLRLVSKYFFTNCPVTNLYDKKIACKFTDKILQLYPFATKLLFWDLQNRISNEGISNLTRLTTLMFEYNTKITKISHLCHLRILETRYGNIIGESEISKLTNLTELDITNNQKITTLNSLSNLQYLRSVIFNSISYIILNNDKS